MNKIMKNIKKFRDSDDGVAGVLIAILLIGLFISGIAFILLGLNTYLPLTIVLLLIISGFGLSRQVLFQNYMNKYIESHQREYEKFAKLSLGKNKKRIF